MTPFADLQAALNARHPGDLVDIMAGVPMDGGERIFYTVHDRRSGARRDREDWIAELGADGALIRTQTDPA